MLVKDRIASTKRSSQIGFFRSDYGSNFLIPVDSVYEIKIYFKSR